MSTLSSAELSLSNPILSNQVKIDKPNVVETKATTTKKQTGGTPAPKPAEVKKIFTIDPSLFMKPVQDNTYKAKDGKYGTGGG